MHREIRINAMRYRKCGFMDIRSESGDCNHVAFTPSSLSEKQMSGCWPETMMMMMITMIIVTMSRYTMTVEPQLQ